MTTPEGNAPRTPARIDLEDFIAAVTRGVARALEEQEDVAGFAITPVKPGSLPIIARPPILVGIFPYPPGTFPGGIEALGGGQVRQVPGA